MAKQVKGTTYKVTKKFRLKDLWTALTLPAEQELERWRVDEEKQKAVGVRKDRRAA
jgi:hypothetical protein